MRKLLIPIIAAASTLAVAAPASAQWAPSPNHEQHHDHDRDFDSARGAMQTRVERIRTQIRRMREHRMLSWREARSLDNEAQWIQRRIWMASRNGIQPGEERNLERRIHNLEWRVQREAGDRNDHPGHDRRY